MTGRKKGNLGTRKRKMCLIKNKLLTESNFRNEIRLKSNYLILELK